VPINDTPSMGPDGTFTVPSPASPALEDAALPDGWLSGEIQALADAVTPEAPERAAEPRKGRKGRHHRPPPPKKPPRPLHVAVAPTPRLVEELSAMSDGYRRSDGTDASKGSPHAEGAEQTLAGLRSVIKQRDSVQPLLVPYSFPDLPTLTQISSQDIPLQEVLEQFSQGSQVLEDALQEKFDPAWLFPPGGRLDAATLEQLQLSGTYGRRIATVGSTSVVPLTDTDVEGCPNAPFPGADLTFACPISVTTGGRDPSVGYAADAGLEERLAPLTEAGANDRLTLQQFFAETSMIREELPGTADRVVEATIPSAWHPSPRLSRILFHNLQKAPWLRSDTPEEALRGSNAPVPRDLVDLSPTVPSDVAGDFYTGELLPAKKTIKSFAGVAEEDADRVRRLQRNLLVAESRSWWRDHGEVAGEFVERSLDEATTELSKIKIIGVNDVTLTSSRGKFQLVLANGTDHPVTVRIAMDAQDKMEIDPELLERLSTTYAPGNHPLTISGRANASGKFPLTVRVESGDGLLIAQKFIEVRSTAFNRIALGITVGAFLFLLLFYLYRVIRRARHKGELEADPA
ncbi:MAG: hypothetical protein QOH90_1599, partial [Actinomycetota bacterium]|nr:hypothetical protein [Actinomycetota bacterium]